MKNRVSIDICYNILILERAFYLTLYIRMIMDDFYLNSRFIKSLIIHSFKSKLTNVHLLHYSIFILDFVNLFTKVIAKGQQIEYL